MEKFDEEYLHDFKVPPHKITKHLLITKRKCNYSREVLADTTVTK